MAIGLDIGSSSIKVVFVGKKGKTNQLFAAGAVRAPVRGVKSEADADLLAMATTIKKLFTDTKIVSREVVVSLPESEIVTRLVTMPSMSDQELAEAIEWEAEQYIPMPIDEANVSYDVVFRPKEKGGQMKVLLVATPKKLVEKYVKILGMAGLRITTVETDMLAAGRSLVLPGMGTTLVCDLGARSSDFAIISGGNLVFSRSMPTAGEALSRALSVGLTMDIVQAEAYKKAYGLTDQLEGKIRAVLLPLVDLIVNEIRKAIEFYKSGEPNDPVKSIVLCGGTAGMPGLVAEMAGKLGTEVVVGDPFAALVKDEKQTAALAGYAPLYGIAVGLSQNQV